MPTMKVAKGEYVNYHWLDTTSAFTDKSTSIERGHITFSVTACTGNVGLYLRPLQLPWYDDNIKQQQQLNNIFKHFDSNLKIITNFLSADF